MTAVEHEVRVYPELLAFLAEHGIPHEVLDGAVVVNPPTTFFHEDVGGSVFAQLWNAAPPELAVLGETFGFWCDPPSYVMPDVAVARRADCVREGTYVAPLLSSRRSRRAPAGGTCSGRRFCMPRLASRSTGSSTRTSRG